MFTGTGTPLPWLANLPGPSRPGSASDVNPFTPIDNLYSMEFDGVGSYIDAGLHPPLTSARTFTIMFWMKANNPGGTTQRLVNRRASNSDRIDFAVGSNELVINVSSLVVDQGTQFGLAIGRIDFSSTDWNHIAVVFNGNFNVPGAALVNGAPNAEMVEQNRGRVKTYINGVFTPFKTYNTMRFPPYLRAFINNTYMGVIHVTGGQTPLQGYFDGYLDEVALYTQTLSAKTIEDIVEITTNQTGKVADLNDTPEGAPFAWYRMGD
tara:strand:- start:4687 stop:5481 length:795 start_codon:yes stop_codon:yes gene_type:complete